MKVTSNILNVTVFEEICGEFDYTQVITSVFMGLVDHERTSIHQVSVLPGDIFRGVIYEESEVGECSCSNYKETDE